MENYIFQINTFYEISVYTKLNACEDLEFFYPSIIIPLGYKVFVYHLNSCVLLVYKKIIFDPIARSC